MQTNRLLLTMFLFFGLLAACSAPAPSSPVAPLTEAPVETPSVVANDSPTSAAHVGQAGPQAISVDSLRNASYSGIYDEPITLVDGRYEGKPYVEGDASRPSVEYIDGTELYGDLDGDGVEDAVVFLLERGGGSGAFTWVAAQLNRNGQLQDAGAVRIEDRIGVKAASLVDGQVRIEIITQGPGDAACCGSHKENRKYSLQDGKLVEIPETNQGLEQVSTADLNSTSWTLSELTNGVPALPDVDVTLNFRDGQINGSAGCNNYNGSFELGSESPLFMTIGPLASARKACPEPISTQETSYLSALQNVSHWGYFFGKLALSYKTDTGEPGRLLFEPISGSAAGPDGESSLPAEASAKLDAFLQSQVYSDSGNPALAAPGLVLYVETPDGVYLKSAGVANLDDGTPMKSEDVLEIGSNTKSMTIVLLMQLVEEGRLSLDDPLSKYLPEQAALFENGDQITIRQLAHHSAGIFDYADSVIAAGLESEEGLEAGFTPEELVQVAAANPSYFAPGEEGKWHYSNTGYILLGMIIESLTGEKLADLYQNRIFDPLGMESAILIEGVPQPGEIDTHGYWWKEDGQRIDTTNMNGSQAWAAGAVAMTAADLATYGKSLAAGKLFKNPDTLQEMLKWDSTAEFSVGFPYGLGLGDFAGDGSAWGHAGQTLGFQSLWFIDPKKGNVVVGLTNSGTYEANAFVNVLNILEGEGALPLSPTSMLPIGDFLPTHWRWVRFTSPAESTDIDEAAGLILTIKKDQSITIGSDPCGVASGSFTVDGTGQITFSELDRSLFTCEADSQAGQLVQHIQNAARWHFANGNLVIELPADGGSMEFALAAQ